jgi:hypothetical protein
MCGCVRSVVRVRTAINIAILFDAAFRQNGRICLLLPSSLFGCLKKLSLCRYVPALLVRECLLECRNRPSRRAAFIGHHRFPRFYSGSCFRMHGIDPDWVNRFAILYLYNRHFRPRYWHQASLPAIGLASQDHTT